MNLPDEIREDFPILKQKVHGKPLIYFDTAATSQKPQSVIQAITDFYTNEYATVHRAIYHLSSQATRKTHMIREKVARFLHALSSDEIIFTKGTTESINLVAHSYGELLSPGDEILITEMEHHSNIVPWQLLAKRKQLKLAILPINDRADLAPIEKHLTPRTKLVAVAHIANSTGTVNPIKQIIEVAHNQGARVLIDAAQSAAHTPIDVQALDADFLAFSSHKAFGPTGIGILYAKKELLEKMPPLYGGGDMVDRVTLSSSTYQPAPLKFEAGTPPIAQIVGLGAAIDYIESIGIEKIQAWEQKLLTYATEKLSVFPNLRIIGTAKEKGPIVSFVLEGVHPLDLGTLLDFEGIAMRTGHHCAQPLLAHFGLEATSRISFAPFNTLREIDIFCDCLQNAIDQF